MLRPTFLAIAAGLLAACAGDDPTSPTGPVPAREHLSQGAMFFLDPEASAATLHAAVYVGATPTATFNLDLPVTGGIVYAGLDDRDDVVLDDLAMSLGASRMAMEDDDLPYGILVSDFMLRTRVPVAFANTLWGEDDDIAMGTDSAAVLSAEWQVSVDIKDVIPWPDPIEVRRNTAIDFDLMILPEKDRLELLAFGHTSPFVWSWGPFVVSSELDLTIDAFVERLD
jgi:hypothetical protein